MKRRHFIRVATSSLALPLALKASSPGRLGATFQDPHIAFFDERFEPARRIAAAWPGTNPTFAVQGDITPTWLGGLHRLATTRPLELRGVTTESFRFCLEVLLAEHARVDARVSRLDRNLRQWTMHSVPKPA